MAIAKSKEREKDLPEIDSGRKSRRNPLLWFILISILAHGLGLLLYGTIKRSQPVAQQKNKPIEFIVVPEESTDKPPPETQRKADNNSVAEKPVEPEPDDKPSVGGESSSKSTASQPQATPPSAKTTPEIAPEPPKPPVTSPPAKTPEIASEPPAPSPVTAPNTAPEPPVTPPPEVKKPEPEPEPEPIEPPIEEQPILSGSNSPLPQPKPNPIKEPKPAGKTKPAAPNSTPSQPENPVATNLPAKIEPTQPANPAPATPPSATQTPGATSGAASLLEGDYQQGLAQGDGDAFFSPEALAYKTVLNPSQLNALKDLDLGPYFAEIRRRVKRNWQPSYAAEDYTTFLTFAIQKDGQITDLRVSRTSGSEAVDRESIKAVQNSAPFAPLPANFPLEALEVEFTFNIYIY